MQAIFVQSQWDTLFAYLQEGDPPLWVLLLIVNGGFLAVWVYQRAKDRPPRVATVNFMRIALVLLNLAVIFSDETLSILRPLLWYIT
jgi:hypothetical protein